MSFNGSGTFVRLYNWVADAAAGINIRADRSDAELDGFATGLSDCVTRDGQSVATANLPMGGFRHTGVGDGVAATDYASVGQVQTAIAAWIAGGGAADAITAAYVPAVTTLTDGMHLSFRATAANATATPTFSPNGLTARTITKIGGTALSPGDIAGALAECLLRYNLANTRWELLNPAAPTSGTWTPSIGGTATYTTQIGTWFRIGKMVFIRCDIVINALGTGSATVLSGLPFTSATSSNGVMAVSNFVSIATAVTWLTVQVNSNSTNVAFNGAIAAQTTASPVIGVFQNSARVTFSGWYEAAT